MGQRALWSQLSFRESPSIQRKMHLEFRGRCHTQDCAWCTGALQLRFSSYIKATPCELTGGAMHLTALKTRVINLIKSFITENSNNNNNNNNMAKPKWFSRQIRRRNKLASRHSVPISAEDFPTRLAISGGFWVRLGRSNLFITTCNLHVSLLLAHRRSISHWMHLIHWLLLHQCSRQSLAIIAICYCILPQTHLHVTDLSRTVHCA